MQPASGTFLRQLAPDAADSFLDGELLGLVLISSKMQLLVTAVC